MSENIVNIHPSKKAANYVRLGHSSHKKLDDLQACGKLKLERVVVDATNVFRQSELLDTLRAVGADLILDAKSAELAHKASFKGSVRKLPWADINRASLLEDFSTEKIRKEYVSKIAEFAIQNQLNSVLSPSHSIEDISKDWLSVDIDLSCLLREALDENGGEDIGIEYPLITKSSLINDSSTREIMIERLSGAEFDNLWLKVSGFGNNASAAGIVKYIKATRDFQELERPLVSDCVGGLVGIAVLAFGATGAISHGIAQKESFNLTNWTKETEWNGGLKTRIYLPELDMFVFKHQAEKLFKEKGMMSLLACKDDCCPNGLMDMYSNSHEHFLSQRFKQINSLNKVPQFNRVHYFLEKMLRPALSNTRKLANSDFQDEKLKKKIFEHMKRLDRIYQALDNLNQTIGITNETLVPNRCRVNSMLKRRRGEAS